MQKLMERWGWEMEEGPLDVIKTELDEYSAW